MNRRAVLAATGAASLGLAGCLGASAEPNSPDKVEYQEGDGCPSVLHVHYKPPSRFPSSAEDTRSPYLDAEDADLRGNGYLAQVLSEARERYEERKDAVEHEDPRSGETRAGPVPLLRDRALAESAEVRNELGLSGKTGSVYVEDGDLTDTFEYGRDHSDCPARDEDHGSGGPIEYHRVWVYYPAEEPSEDDTVLDAEEKGVPEHEYLSRIFETAHDEYERREDDLRESSDRTVLVEDRDSELGTSDIRDELDADASELGSRGVYVECEGIPYRLRAVTVEDEP